MIKLAVFCAYVPQADSNVGRTGRSQSHVVATAGSAPLDEQQNAARSDTHLIWSIQF